MEKLAVVYIDKFTGKKYRIMNGNSARVQQYPANATIWFDGSSDLPHVEINLKTRANLNSWLRMMTFK